MKKLIFFFSFVLFSFLSFGQINADFTASSQTICEDECITFTDQSTTTAAGGIVSWTWAFPGGLPSTYVGQNPPCVIYDTQGTYAVHLSIEDSDGNTDVMVTSGAFITVNPTPNLSINFVDYLCDNSAPVTLEGNPPGGTFSGDGVSGGLFDPTGAGVGLHTITYEYTGANGCYASTTSDITVNAAPHPIIDPVPDFCEDASPYTLVANPSGGVFDGPGLISPTEIDPGQIPPGTYTFHYYYFDANGCSSPTSFDVTIHPLPEPAIDPVADLCENDASVTLVGNPSGGTFSGAGISGNSFNPGTAGIGTHTITYDYTDVYGCFASTTINITVVPAPTATINPVADLCENGAPVTLVGNPAGGTFSGTGVSGNSFDPSIAGVGTYTITYTYEDANGCSDSESTDITVKPVPTFTLNYTDPTTCGGTDGTITISGLDPNTNYDISYNNGSPVGPTGMTSNSSGVIVLTGLGAGSYTGFTVGLNGCPVTNTGVTLTDPNAPTVNAGADQTVCEGTAVTITSTNPDGANISWNPSVTEGVPFIPTGTQTYTVTAELNGCSSSDDVTITVNPKTLPTFPPIGDLCIGDTPPTLHTPSNEGIDGTWNPPTVNNSPVGSTTYTFTPAIGECATTQTIDITVNPLPTPTINPVGDLCENDAVITLIGNPSGGTFSGTGVSGNTFDPSAAGPGTHTIIYTYTDANGCSAAIPATINIIVNPAPTFTLTYTDPTTCSGTDGTITIGGLDPNTTYDISYNDGNPVGPITMTTNALGEIVITGLDAGSYTGFNVGLGGCTVTNTGVTLSDPNSPIIDAGPDQEVCAGDQVTITANNPDGANISWNPSVTEGVPFIPTGTQTYTVTAELNGCTSTDEITITVNPLPTPSIDPVGDLCENDAVITLIGNPAGGTFSGTGVSGNTFDPSAAGPGTHTIIYTYTDANGCSAAIPTTINIIVNPAPTFTLNHTNPTTCGGTDGTITITGLDPNTNYDISYNDGNPVGPTTMTTNASGEIVITGLDAGSYTGFTVGLGGCTVTNIGVNLTDPGSPTIDAGPDQEVCAGDQVTITANNPDGANVSWNPSVTEGVPFIPTGTQTYTVTAELNGCISTDEIIITVNPLPTPSIDPVGDLCENDAVITLVGNPAGGTFSGAGVTGNNFDPSIGEGSYTITYEYTDANGCSAVIPTTINIIVNPAPTFTLNYTDPTTCGGTEGTITITGLDPNTNYDISYDDGTPVGPITMTTDASGEIVITGLDAGSYTGFTVGLGGCTVTNPVVTLTDPDLPTIVAGTDQTVCAGTSVTITANNPDGANITWDPIITDGVPFIPTGTQTYTVTAELNNCISTDEITITVNPLPTPSIDAVADLCENDAIITLVGTPAGGTFSGTGVTGNTFDPSAAGAGTHTITYNYTDANGCSATTPTTVDIIVNPAPTFTLTYTDPTTCAGTEGTITISGLNPGTNYDISYDVGATTVGPTTMTANASGIIIITGLGAGSYTGVTVGLGSCTVTNTGVTLSDPGSPTINAGPDQTVCEGTDVTLTATNPDNANISWAPLITDGVPFTATATQTYTVTAELNGCFSSDDVTITVNLKETPLFTQIVDFCENTLAPTLELESNNFIEGTWNPAVVSNTIIGATTYTFTPNTGECATQQTMDITVNPLPTPTIDAVADLCEDGVTVTLEATPTGGTFSGTGIIGNDFDPTIAGVGTHTITYNYTDVNGCSAATPTTIDIVVKPVPTFTLTFTGPTTCSGTEGTITISGLENNTDYDISYNDGTPVGPTGMTSNVSGEILITGLGAGSYTDFSVDLDGCAGTVGTTITLTDPNAPNVGAGADQTVCEGTDITLTATNPDNANISWAPLITDGVPFTAIGTQTYTVTAELNDCISTDDVTITVNQKETPLFTQLADFCLNTTAPILETESTNNIEGTWNPATVDNSTVGPTTYTFTPNTGECATQQTMEITVNPLPTPTIDYVADLCIDNAAVTLVGNPTGGTFSGAGITGNDFDPIIAGVGTHTITYNYTDVNGCSAATPRTMDITVNPSPTFTITPTDPTCENNNGEIMITPGSGVTIIDYSIDNGTTTQTGGSFPNLPEGSYTVYVIDNNGCEATETQTLTNVGTNDDPSFTLTDFCFGTTNSATITGTPGGTFSIVTPAGGGATIDPLTGEITNGVAGTTYKVKYETNGACPTSETQNVKINSIPTYFAVKAEPTCGDNNGKIIITPGPGITLNSFSIDNGATTQIGNTFSNLGAGTYNILITDINGCIATGSETLSNQGGAIIDNITSTESSCLVDNGKIMVSASGGLGSLSYSLDNGQTSNNGLFTGVAGGTYVVTVTDGNGCKTITTITVGKASGPSLTTVSSTNISCYGENDGSAEVIATGGTAPYSYNWSPIGGNNTTVTGLSPGTYTVTVKDSERCPDTLQITISEPDSITIVETITNSNCGLDNGEISLIVTGGQGNYTYDWDPNVSSTDEALDLANGNYEVTVTDDNGCSQTILYIVSRDNTFYIEAIPDSITILQGESADLHVFVDPNSTIDNIIWSPSDGLSCTDCKDPIATPNTSTIYYVEVTDDNGCKSIDSVIVNLYLPCADIFVPNTFSPNGDGLNDLQCVLGGCITSMDFTVYNRWGETVFHTNDQKECWDGTFRGKYVQTDIYVYKLKATLENGEMVERTGNMTVVR